MTTNPRSEPFFPLVTIVMIALIFAGFGSAFAIIPDMPFPPRAALIFHGGVTLGWFVLTVVQTILIRRTAFDLHRKLGWASIALAVLIVVTGYITTANAAARPDWSINGRDPLASTVFPFFDLVTFALFYTLGILNRKNRLAHKRLMVLAGVMMIDPAAGRLGGIVFGNPAIIVGIELALLSAFFIYDWRTLRRVHWASVLGAIVFIGCMAARFALAETQAWHEFAGLIIL